MTRFGTLFASVGMPVLLQQMGETVIYRPNGGRPRSIEMILDRNPPEPIEEIPEALAPRIVGTALNDERLGISSGRAAAIDTGGDAVDVTVRVGGEVTTRPITKVLRHDEAVIEVAIR
jgi:hypothetical protein